MANILTVPTSGIISFDGLPFPSLSVQPLSTAPRLAFDGIGGLKIQSLVTSSSSVERFSVEGTQGRLFTVNDSLTGILFSVNDITGLPILEIKDTDTIVAGEYNSNAFVISGKRVSVGSLPFDSSSFGVSGNFSLIGLLSTRDYGTSSNWYSVYSNVNSLSSKWNSVPDVIPTVTNYLSTNNVLLSSAVITGNLRVYGTIYSPATSNTLAKQSFLIGDGINASFNLNHNFNSYDLQVQVYEANTNILSYPLVQMVDTNNVEIDFEFVPPANSYRVVVFASIPSNQINAYGEIYTYYIRASGLGDVPALSSTWISTYSTVNANSATTWNYQGTDLKALSANWQSTYTNFSTNSSKYEQSYTNVSSNSANWNTGYQQSTVYAVNSGLYISKTMALAFSIAL